MRPIYVTLSDASGGAKTSDPIPLDQYARPQISLQVNVTGTANFTVQQTLDDIFDPAVTPVWVDHPDTALVGATATAQGNYAYVPKATRIVLNSGNGSVKFDVVQAGLIG